MLSINLRVRDVIPYMLVKRADTIQQKFESIFSLIKIHTFINTCEVLKHAKVFVMRAALKFSTVLKVKEALHMLWEGPNLNKQVQHYNFSLTV